MNNNSAIPELPLEICKQYALSQISREKLIKLLVEYDYNPEGKTDGYDWLTVNPPGTWSEISAAIDLGYIDESIYEEVFKLKHPDWKE